jgi:ABC-type branched-subunit amino acid transport system substrate-binding protein
MKRTILLVLLLSVTGAAIPASVHAQFWKKIFGKEEKKPVRKPVQRPPASNNNNSKKPVTTTKAKREELQSNLAQSVKKQRYRVEVLAPLYLNELVKGGKTVYKSHLPDKVLPGLNFYQGIKLAADTLNGLGYNLDVYVHDITDPSKTIDLLLKGGRLDTADLIIGAVQSSQVAQLAALAKKKNINFVSVLTPVDAGVKSNYYFSIIQPTLESHCEAIRAAVRKRERHTTNLLMYYRSTVPVDVQAYKYLTRDSPFAYTKVLVNTILPNDKLRNFLDSNSSNIIVMPILDVTYATQLLDQLSKSFPKYQFEVFGMPSWKGMSALRKAGSHSNLGIHISSPFYFDQSNSAGKGFSDAYNNKFGGRPAEMSYRGYETLYWYAYLLKRYGTVFNDHYADNGAAPFTRFRMTPNQSNEGNTQYYENTHVYIYRYQGGSFSVEQ